MEQMRKFRVWVGLCLALVLLVGLPGIGQARQKMRGRIEVNIFIVVSGEEIAEYAGDAHSFRSRAPALNVPPLRAA